MRNAVLVSAVRTPVGRCRGALASVEAYKLGAIVVKEALKRAKIEGCEVDEIIFGNLMGHDINNMARMVSLESGIPVEVPALEIDRQCGTSLNAIALGAMMIQAGEADVILAGGVESDSRRPYILNKSEKSYDVRPPEFCTDLRLSPEWIGNPSMGITAENLAQKYQISREECDAFSMTSHVKASAAVDKGLFNDQMIPVEIPMRKGGVVTVREDESVRRNVSIETMSSLRPAFKKDGIVTAGNSSPMSDGASAVIVMEESMAREKGLEILGRIKGFAAAGCDPNIMGIGPVPATRKLLKKVGLSLDDIDLIEMNEAFAAQSIACIKELNIDTKKLNVNGGAIALGHPLAGTGAILVTKLVYEMKRRNVGKGLVTFCCGGGQGVAMLIEREVE